MAIALTAADTSGARISSDTSVPLMAMLKRSGSSSMSISARRTRSATAAVSVRSTPSCRASQVAARYIAPVSRNCRPSRLATPRAVLDFPDPLGPSMAMTSGREVVVGSVRVSDIRSAYRAGLTRPGISAGGGQATDHPRASIIAVSPSLCSGATESAR